MPSPGTALAGLGTQSLDLATNTNLGQDLSSAGMSFGSMIQGVGNAVALTQRKLAKTSADTATALAKTKVDVIAVEETNYDDSGNIISSTAFKRNLPLIDFVDPVFYQWTQVRMQGKFFVHEVATASQAKNSDFTDHSGSGQHGLLVIFGGGHTGIDFQQTDSTTSTSFDQASAVGIARMYAQLNPRSDVGVPKPTQVIQGPSLNIVDGPITDVPAAGANPATRTMSLLLQLHRSDGTAIPGKTISVDTDGTPWSFSAASTTAADGSVAITLTRTFLPVPPGSPPGTTVDMSPKQIVVTARLGMVTNNTTVTF